MALYDTVVRGGRVVAGGNEFDADIAVKDGSIVAIGQDLPVGTREISAVGRLVLPGGIDSHAHVEQVSAAGMLNADTWESATTAAALGGTTTVIAFAAQHVGMKLPRVVEDYHALAARGALIDYSFHLIIADPTPETIEAHLPPLLDDGYRSVKVFTTYDRLKVDDEGLLDIFLAARSGGALVTVHAENHGMIKWRTRQLIAEGREAPKYHAASHPREAEVEAIERVIRLAGMVGQPLMIFHVSTAEGAELVRQARGRGQAVFGETCTHYLLLTERDLDRPGLEGAKWICSPPLRTDADCEALWSALRKGDLQTITSDHAPYAFDATGKLHAGPNARFDKIPSGMPGIGLRLPLLFDAMVSSGRFSAACFAELTATAPARIYGLAPRKGDITIGADADIVVWNQDREVRITDATIPDRTGYTPFAGRTIRGWPETVIRRGETIAESGRIAARPGSGVFLRQARQPSRTAASGADE